MQNGDDVKPALAKRFASDIYPRLEDEAAMDALYVAYMSGEDLETAAELLDIPWRTAKYWAQKAGWVDERTKVDAIEVAESNRKLMMSRARKVNAIVDRTVEIQNKITQEVEKWLDDPNKNATPGNIKLAAEAARNASDNSLRAVGIGESGASASEEIKAKQKQPLVVVFQGGDLPPVRKSNPVIEVIE